MIEVYEYRQTVLGASRSLDTGHRRMVMHKNETMRMRDLEDLVGRRP